MRLSEEHPGATAPLPGALLSNLTFFAWTDAGPNAIEDLAGYYPNEYTVGLVDGATRLSGAAVSPSLFGILRATPAHGRFFTPTAVTEGAPPVVVLSHALWRDEFGEDPEAVGRGLVIDGVSHTIIGVAQPGFSISSPRGPSLAAARHPATHGARGESAGHRVLRGRAPGPGGECRASVGRGDPRRAEHSGSRHWARMWCLAPGGQSSYGRAR